MDMDQAAVWLAGSILTMLGMVVVVAGVIVINNIIHKYWKPIRIFTTDSWVALNPPHRFASQDELDRVTPHLDDSKKDSTK